MRVLNRPRQKLKFKLNRLDEYKFTENFIVYYKFTEISDKFNIICIFIFLIFFCCFSLKMNSFWIVFLRSCVLFSCRFEHFCWTLDFCFVFGLICSFSLSIQVGLLYHQRHRQNLFLQKVTLTISLNYFTNQTIIDRNHH